MKMAILKLSILAAAFVCACAVPQKPPTARTTIFGDEKLEGQVFENLQYKSEDVTPQNTAANAYRLPTTTRPLRYDLHWDINIANISFTGEVDIYLYATQAGVNEIVIHSQDLQIDSVNLYRYDNEITEINKSYYLQPAYDFLRVQLVGDNTLEYDANINRLYRLSIKFGAPLRDDMYGLYQSWFRNGDSEKEEYMATTQFQATSARKAFPCYDEPSFKATFDISVRRDATYRSWSCTRIKETRPDTPNFEVDVYETTPVMSTYLLALIVAKYESQSVTNSDGLLTYEVIGRPGAFAENQQEYAFDVGQKLLNEMNDHTAIDFHGVYKHIKMTHASIPDFSAGAMENWGLLTYREAYLMYDRDNTNSNSKQLIAYILSHEIAHMWFGNLVTNEWWDVLWLNEGFARYYQYFLTHWVEDYMGFETRFIVEQIHTALLSDSTAGAHPLSNTGIGSQAAASSMFSTITYNKGAAVIRMTEKLLGFEVHREGLRNYLRKRQFNVSLPIHLFQELQYVAEKHNAISEYGPDFSVIEYYRSWTEQGGHPVLNVQVNHQTGEMLVSQQRFNINNGYGTASRNWIIPITFATKSNPDFENTKPTHIIRNTVTRINRSSIGDEWVIFNIQQSGFYRVNYDHYTWDLIALALRENREIIHEYNRAQIVNDIFQFARSGIMPYSRALNILSFLENEVDYAPWAAAITGFNWLRNRFATTENLPQLEHLIVNWTTTVIQNITYEPYEDESFMRSYLRMQIAPTLCAINVRECRESANEQFRRLFEGNSEVPPDSRPWVYCNALREGSEAYFDFLYNRFLSHNVYNEKIVILSALGCTPHERSLEKLLVTIFEENFQIRRQDYGTAYSAAVSGNEVNTQIVFRYIQNNLEKVQTAYSLASSLSTIASRLRSVEEIDAFQEWARNNRQALGSSFNAIINAAEDTRRSISWTEEVLSDVLHYLVSGGDDIETSSAAPSTPTVPPSTVTAGPLVVPSTPTLPDSAVTSALSVSVMFVMAIANFAL